MMIVNDKVMGLESHMTRLLLTHFYDTTAANLLAFLIFYHRTEERSVAVMS